MTKCPHLIYLVTNKTTLDNIYIIYMVFGKLMFDNVAVLSIMLKFFELYENLRSIHKIAEKGLGTLTHTILLPQYRFFMVIQPKILFTILTSHKLSTVRVSRRRQSKLSYNTNANGKKTES